MISWKFEISVHGWRKFERTTMFTFVRRYVLCRRIEGKPVGSHTVNNCLRDKTYITYIILYISYVYKIRKKIATVHKVSMIIQLNKINNLTYILFNFYVFRKNSNEKYLRALNMHTFLSIDFYVNLSCS